MAVNGCLLVEIPALPPSELSLNYSRMAHWSVRHKARQAWKDLVRLAVRQAKWKYEEEVGKPWCKPPKAVVSLLFIYPQYRRRDQTNLHVMWKPGEDSLVEEGVIIDDDLAHLMLDPPKVIVDKSRAPMTIVEVRDATKSA